MPRWGLINKALGLGIPEPVETYSSSPHLYEDLDIPEGTKGRLPRDKRDAAPASTPRCSRTWARPARRTQVAVTAPAAADVTAPVAAARSTGGRDGSRSGSRDGGRDTRRSGGASGAKDSGRSGDRRRRPAEAEASTGPAAEAPAGQPPAAPTEVDRATRARRRTRTRRRNGEVVAGEAQAGAPARSTEA